MENKTKKEINECLSSIRESCDMQSVCRLHSLAGGVFRHIALRYLCNSHDADDLVQDFWADIFQIASKYRYNFDAYAYLCRTFTNMAINRAIKNGRDVSRALNYVDYENVASDGGKCMENVILNNSIQSAMASLDEEEKSVVQLTYFEDKTVREIAKMLDKSKSQIARVKKTALAKLKNKLADNGDNDASEASWGERV